MVASLSLYTARELLGFREWAQSEYPFSSSQIHTHDEFLEFKRLHWKEYKYHEKRLLTEQSQIYIQQWIDETGYSSNEEREINERIVNCSKKDSPVWKGMEHYRGDIKTNGKLGSDKRFYRWDNFHNDIEVYNRRGEHLGSMDPRTGNMYRGPDPTNSISDLL